MMPVRFCMSALAAERGCGRKQAIAACFVPTARSLVHRFRRSVAGSRAMWSAVAIIDVTLAVFLPRWLALAGVGG
jgi:hypothetical protein